MEHPIFDLTFAGSRESVLCGFPVEHLHQRLKDMDGQW